MTIEAGTSIGPYTIKTLIGAGGMGEVYRAHDERLGRDVAVKLMSEGASGDATRMRRMQQEARAAGQLSHPNILAVFDVGTHGARMYLVTELLEGESLREVVRRGPVPWRTALKIATQTADGLSAAHERGIVHRDIKPDNVFVTRDDRVKVLDFGVATWRGPDEGLAEAHARTLSQSGLLVGTVGYMSPEQARGQAVDHRTDLFAFGCLLYELLSGREAFQGGSALEVLVAIQRDAPPPLHDLVPGLPADLVRIVERCLEKDPARRFQSARDLLFALSLIQTSGASVEPASAIEAPPRVEPPPPSPAPRTSRRAILGLALSTVAAGPLAIAGYRALARAPEPPSFQQLTFRRGTVYTARFTVDGASVIYSAAWDGQPRELYTTVPGSRDPRSLERPNTDVAVVLASGEISVIRRSARGFSRGVLSRISLAGGPPKDQIDGVTWADGSPDGALLTVIRRVNGRAVLELPAGRAVAESASLGYPRVSPDGERVAFLEYNDSQEDAGTLVVVDRSGKRLLASEGWKSIEGLAWRSNDEIWFTASKEGRSLWMHALDRAGRTRLLCRAPGRLVLHDLAADGRVVAERNSYRCTLMAGTGGPERDLSWQDFSQLGQLSRDGKQMLFSEQGDGAGSGVVAYLRSLQGDTPVRLGSGLGLALSADGQQALLRVEEQGPHLEVVPVGAGRSERLPPGPLVMISWAAFVPGAARVVMQAKEAGKEERLYVQELGGAPPRPFGPDGVAVFDDAVSPDGRLIAATQDGKVVLLPLDGSAPRELAGLAAEHRPVGWSTDQSTLFLRSASPMPLQLFRYTLATGKLEPWRTLTPPDPAGVLGLDRLSLARDGEVYVYESYRLLSDLYIIGNLR